MSIKLKNILCPVDFSESSSHALKYAVTMAEQFKSTLYVIHIIPHVSTFSRTAYYDGDENKTIEKLCEDQIPKNISHEFDIIKDDDIDNGIIKFAKEKVIDLIIMGSHGHNILENILLGSSVESVSRKAPCPMMIIRHPEHEFITSG